MSIGIYKITSPSGKIYIGQSVNIEGRWKIYSKFNCKNQTKLYSSLVKHGYENHKFEIIEKCLENQLLERENYWKDFYRVLEIPSLCCRKDGRGGKLSYEMIKRMSKPRSEQAKQNMKISKTEKFKENLRKPKPEGFGEKISKIKKEQKIKFSQEHKDKISILMKNREITWKEKISKSIQGKIRSEDTKQLMSIIRKNLPIKGKNIYQFSLNNIFVKEWSKIKEASHELNIKAAGISNNLTNITKTAGGYIWKYKNLSI